MIVEGSFFSRMAATEGRPICSEGATMGSEQAAGAWKEGVGRRRNSDRMASSCDGWVAFVGELRWFFRARFTPQ